MAEGVRHSSRSRKLRAHVFKLRHRAKKENWKQNEAV